ncbi:MAG: hypothetical protein MUP67_05530 [Acidimicrobiia bacterium]|nr:hypothetical protein [Acidimicrobiia bacterium]
MILRRLARGDADPKADRRAANDNLQCPLLHRDRTVHRVDGTSEYRHEAVAGVLDLVALVLRKRLAEHREVLASHVVPATLTEPREQIRRSHDVAEENRHRASSAHAISLRSPPRRDR